ncbi:DUF86 domain-containing protein [Caldifermentibacillus hisashii]|jgi:uncharacterized protein YutE (UPF0331/DUF86 family)|uniref:DUF86 domain-containing protein n=2 Tax=Bacillaceae TaxID=186817 RepID=A0A090J1M3_9BACI|nr:MULTISPECIES: DUF86 domain-containing protein [Bacillaceae]MCB5934694.1 DUF86 domain-containing protein [Bacillus sp. DFI.2.34]NWN97361.1 DUF86 domain-containing protein [Bacillus sp. (in: firmicutes)]KIO60852.1 hypothetical protein B4166_0232 [Caldibacillus thermoamylovorans]KIO71241.1 hypothetical protein B4167_0195 [Caldibacillus thermoamylovorans]MBU5342249.1 DUF86 domain-containing protein [Caldifermentibacillus hisashii]
MFFVDREKIEDTLTFLEGQINIFNQLDQIENQVQKAALERVAQMMLESVIDVGNSLIDGFIMRDPGSYEDIIDILLDEQVIGEKDGEQLKKLIPFRKSLVLFFTSIDHEELYRLVNENLQAFIDFPTHVRTYLAKELGPVSAFKSK